MYTVYMYVYVCIWTNVHLYIGWHTPCLYMYMYILTCMHVSHTGVQALATPITAATIELYQRIVRDLPPTPSKFHYIFNLRDLSRIYHGLFTTTPERFDETGPFVRVWRNECLRVFYDRLTNDKDRGLVSDHISELLQQNFQDQAEVETTIYMYMMCTASYINVHVHLYSFLFVDSVCFAKFH